MKTLKLLTIGNSFSHNALTFLEPLATAEGRVNLVVGTASLGGCSLEKHWNLAEYTARHPEYKPYALNDAHGEVTLQEALAAEPWDFVTLQQVSAKSWLRDSFEPYLGQLIALVRALAPRAEILLHQTWAYRADSPFLPEKGLTPRGMHDGIEANYGFFARKYDLRVLPSGRAVQQARETPGRAFRWPDPDYDYASPVAPALPDQRHSLAVGWRWAINSTPDGRPVLTKDPNHLNSAGCYLIGCLWYELLSGYPIGNAAFVPEGLEAESAKFLRGVAHEVARNA